MLDPSDPRRALAVWIDNRAVIQARSGEARRHCPLTHTEGWRADIAVGLAGLRLRDQNGCIAVVNVPAPPSKHITVLSATFETLLIQRRVA